MYPTKYHKPKTIDEARDLHTCSQSASFLSGGHTLLPAMRLRLASADDLIDLGGVPEMRGITGDRQLLSIGALTLHDEVGTSPIVRELIPALAGCAGSIGDRHVRHRGTIGGSVANNDPAADYPTALLALGATVLTDRRRMLAEEFFTGLYETALQSGEIVLRVEFPVPALASYAKFRSTASRYSVVGVFIARTASGVRVAVTGAGSSGVFRVGSFEVALNADYSPQALDKCYVDPSTLMEDANGTPQYRANLIKVMARRAVENPGVTKSFN